MDIYSNLRKSVKADQKFLDIFLSSAYQATATNLNIKIIYLIQ